MVSLRRRKLLGLCAGVWNSTATHSSNPTSSVHPMPVDDINLPVKDNDPSRGIGSSDVPGSTQVKDQNDQTNDFGSTFTNVPDNQSTPEQEVKRRKQPRRRRTHNQEQSVMRGVYFKNMKWQAAIKVDKKQIHLGTVSSAEEAAHLYDRAAFMCGREPNFELPEDEKQELKKFKWDEFLAMTRRAITSKKTRRRHGTGAAPASVPISDWEGEAGAEGISISDDVEPDSDSPTFESLSIGQQTNSSSSYSRAK